MTGFETPDDPMDPDARVDPDDAVDNAADALAAEPAELEEPEELAEPADWDPTGLELARSVVGSLLNSAAPAQETGRRPSGGRGDGSSRRRRKGGFRLGAGADGQQLAYSDLVGRSGAHPDDRDPQALDDTIGRLVADRGWNTNVAVAGALSRWDQIVGPQIAEHCRAERYAAGVLTVRADSTAWATQVRLLAATLVRRLNEDLGDGTVDRIVVQGPSGHDWRKGGVGTRDARGPRDTFG